MVYTVTIDSKVEFQESTIAACKALVSGLDCGWTIHLAMNENGARHAVGIVKGSYKNSKPMAFCLGSNFSVQKSTELLASFKRSRAEKEVNNTTYISAESFIHFRQFGKKNKCEKLLELCGF